MIRKLLPRWGKACPASAGAGMGVIIKELWTK